MSIYTLAQIKLHPNFPFIDFEVNSQSFLLLELYWSQLFADITRDFRKDWASLQKAEMDGNPIFCATSLSLKRQLRIIQKVNKENKPAYPTSSGEGVYYGLQVWLNKGFTIDGRTPLNELVLHADVSNETEKEAIKFIESHCLHLFDEETMENLIAVYEDRVNMPE